jgi:hypothetical protein
MQWLSFPLTVLYTFKWKWDWDDITVQMKLLCEMFNGFYKKINIWILMKCSCWIFIVWQLLSEEKSELYFKLFWLLFAAFTKDIEHCCLLWRSRCIFIWVLNLHILLLIIIRHSSNHRMSQVHQRTQYHYEVSLQPIDP